MRSDHCIPTHTPVVAPLWLLPGLSRALPEVDRTETGYAHALAWPERMPLGVCSLALIAQGRLDFQAPEEDQFPCLRHARGAVTVGGTAAATFHASHHGAGGA